LLAGEKRGVNIGLAKQLEIRSTTLGVWNLLTENGRESTIRNFTLHTKLHRREGRLRG